MCEVHTMVYDYLNSVLLVIEQQREATNCAQLTSLLRHYCVNIKGINVVVRADALT